MNNFLLRGLLGATVCLVAGSAFAQTTETDTLGVSNDVTLTTDSKDKAISTEKTLEMYTTRTDGKITREYLGLMSFRVPVKKGYVVKSANLKLVTERAKGTLAIYGFGAEVSDDDTYNSQIDNVNAARKNPIATVRLRGTEGKAVTDKDASSNIEDWVNNIDITDYVKAQADGHVNLLLLNNAETTGISIKVYTSDAKDVTNDKVTPNFTFKAEDLHPQLTVVYEEDADQKTNVSLPTADTWVRKDAANNNYGSKTTMELKSKDNTDFVGLMSFSLPAEVLGANNEVKSATLRLVTERPKGSREFSLYKYVDFAENTNYKTEEGNLAAARTEANLIGTYSAKGQGGKSFPNDAVSDEFKTVDAWTNTIDLTDYVKGLDTNSFAFLIEHTNSTEQLMFYTKETDDVTNGKDATIVFKKEDLVPQLTVVYTKNTYNLKVSEAGAATLVLPYETEIPEGVKAYTLTYTSGNNAVATEVKNVIPANTPVLVNAEPDDYTFKATATLTKKADKPVSGNLHGVWSEEVVPEGSYVLQYQSGTVAFYRVGAAGFKVKANQAYLYAPEAAGAKMLNIDFGGEATAINGVEAEASNANTQVYTIDGKKANRNNLAKGQVYVTNGKTFILK